MRAREIIKLMQGTLSDTGNTMLDLENMVEEYPYFQAAQLLYTMNLRANKDSRFNAELRKTACQAGDRKKLFFRIENDFFPPLNLGKLEKPEEIPAGTSFERVDLFLSGQPELPPQATSTDYLPYVLTDEAPDVEKTDAVELQHQDTIDRFLETDKKSPVKIVLKEPGTAVESGFREPDAVEEGSFFSETLAKIYLKQKKYDKALEIIRKLNLIYPEKNRYFADQIRFLEKLIINTKI